MTTLLTLDGLKELQRKFIKKEKLPEDYQLDVIAYLKRKERMIGVCAEAVQKWKRRLEKEKMQYYEALGIASRIGVYYERK